MLHTDIPHESAGDNVHLGTTQGIYAWCIFDNTALGAAMADARTVKSHLLASRRVTG
jgi:hypothetical protein